jgi:autotransporter-associated beta strand protein
MRKQIILACALALVPALWTWPLLGIGFIPPAVIGLAFGVMKWWTALGVVGALLLFLWQNWPALGSKKTRIARIATALAGLTLVCCEGSTALGQTNMPAQSTNIPLQYVFDSQSNQARLSINIGINGGTPQPYLFDTGSTLFIAAYNPTTWNNFGGANVPNSTVPNGNGIQLCYSGSTPTQCRGYTGNIVQVPTLSFYAPGATSGATPAATFTASPGFQINAASSYTDSEGNNAINYPFPGYFSDNTAPPQEGLFYGVFGSRISVDLLNKGTCSGSNCYIAGGVLGQTIVPGAIRQGYIVTANGQPNPVNVYSPGPTNPPYGTQIVSIGGQTQPVTSCSPCVTVGLTPQLIGQFAPVGLPTPNSAFPGLVQWVSPTPSSPAPPFPYPYGSGTGNNSAPTDGTIFTVIVTEPGSSTPTSSTGFGLLDTGTRLFSLNSAFSAVGSTGSISIVGATPSSGSIPGLPISTSTLTGGPAYTVNGSGTTSTIGIPFFMQNSVMFDLSDQVTGYTPFFVTNANLATTAGGPLVVSAANVPLGLAGVISGPGGITIKRGGAVQLSATNTYTGPTMISGAAGGTQGMLFISGPGSIAASSRVVNDGLFDISRAWAPVSITTLSGTGWVSLGGQNLTITNGSDTFSGAIADGGTYPASGGNVTVAGGTQTFAGANSYTGGTTVSGGTLNLTGTMIGDLTILPGATFTATGGYAVAPGVVLNNAGTFQSLGGAGLSNQGIATNSGTFSSDVLNTGSFKNNGLLSGAFVNLGALGGTGEISGTLANAGIAAPGNPYGTMAVSGSYMQTASGTLQISVSPTGQSSRLNVIGTPGTAALAGSVFAQLQPTGLYAPRSTYTILSAGGGVSGSFSNVTSNLPFLQPSLGYDANNVYLTLQIGGFGNIAQNPVQRAVGSALDSTAPNATGDYALVIGTMAGLTASQVQPILASLSGANYAAFSSAMVQGAQLFMNNFASQAGRNGSPTGNRVALAEACDVACDATASPRWGAWGGAVGGLGTIGAGASQGAVTYNAGGFAAGLDRAFTDSFRAGVTVGSSAGTQWVSGFNGQGNTGTVQFGLYGNYADGPVYADALFGYAYSSNRMTRQIVIPGLQSRTAWGQAGANQFFGQFETGYRIDVGTRADAYVTPFARLQAYTGTQNGFTESGAQSLDLSVAQQTTNSLRSVIGAQFGTSMDMGWREKLAMQVRLGWSHEYADVSRPVTAALGGAPAAPFTTFGVSPTRDGVLLGFGASTAIAEATSLYLRYEGTLAGQDSSHALTAGVRMTW